MLLSAEHLSINFGSRQLLEDVNFYLNEGDKVGVIGINGTGKSTFLKVLSGVTEPDGGTISRNLRCGTSTSGVRSSSPCSWSALTSRSPCCRCLTSSASGASAPVTSAGKLLNTTRPCGSKRTSSAPTSKSKVALAASLVCQACRPIARSKDRKSFERDFFTCLAALQSRPSNG